MIKVMELFGGIGACTQAMKRLGIEFKVVDYVEIDKYAVKSYNAINGTNYEPQDITEWDKDIEADLLVGGFPCQDISVAGLGKGIVKGETRSGLMYEMMRIIEKTKPQYVIAENVKNLLSKKFRPQLEEYLCFLSEQGYEVTMDVLNAKEFGVPQSRERVFIMGMKHENGNANRGNMHKVCKEILESLEEQGKIQIANYQFPEKQELTIRLKDILEDEVDEKYYISPDKVEKLVKQIVEKQGDKGIGALIKQATSTGSIYCKNGGVLNMAYPESDTRRGRVISDGNVCGTIECADHIGRLEIEKVLIDDTNSEQFGNCRLYKDNAPSLRSQRQGQKVVEIPTEVEVRKYDVDVEKLKVILIDAKKNSGLTINQISKEINVSKTKVEHWFRKDDCFSIPDKEVWFGLKELLNISTDEFDLPVTEFIVKENTYDMANRFYHVDGIAPTLTCGIVPNIIGNAYVIYIRKLTPKECWRLMGFTDDVFELAEQVNSNSQLYKQAGNSIVVDVLVQILIKIFER